MKRDMDLIRQIALETAELEHDQWLDSLPEVEPHVFAAHVVWMEEAGLVKATINQYLSGETSALVQRLTWDGCEFADAVRSDTVWKKAKDNVIKPSASFTFRFLLDYVKAEIQKGLPTLGG
ncbi:MAG: DUF2513 domain-containing protein [Xylophilus ampelinus]